MSEFNHATGSIMKKEVMIFWGLFCHQDAVSLLDFFKLKVIIHLFSNIQEFSTIFTFLC